VASASNDWLVVGHGSVGSFVAARLRRGGARVYVLDPSPRVPAADGELLDGAGDLQGGRIGYVVSCVPPEAAESVPAVTASLTTADAFFFDLNTVSPHVKQRIRDVLPIEMIDVALLDSLDAEVERPFLAISGRRVDRAARVLRPFGFAVSVAGEEIGQAAALKYLRSIFTKGLEALVLEYAALAAGVEGAQLVRASLENSLGRQFVGFMDLLLTTNRIHAERRSRELAEALAMFTGNGTRPELTSAAVEVLCRAAAAWQNAGAPPSNALTGELAAHLRSTLWPQTALT
jgi:3-hydroxyisobutyrate dehydrogenase